VITTQVSHPRSAFNRIPLLECDTRNRRFESGLKKLQNLPLHRSRYEIARCLWDMWKSDPPEADTFWLVSMGPRLTLAGIAVISEQTRSNWSNYYSIDDTISWEQTDNFQLTRDNIVFGPHQKPGFWGLYRHLKKVYVQLIKKRRASLSQQPA